MEAKVRDALLLVSEIACIADYSPLFLNALDSLNNKEVDALTFEKEQLWLDELCRRLGLRLHNLIIQAMTEKIMGEVPSEPN